MVARRTCLMKKNNEIILEMFVSQEKKQYLCTAF